MPLSDADRATLLRLAREAIAARLSGGPPPELVDAPRALAEHGGVFITIYKEGQLRGCLGELEPRRPLWRSVTDMAPRSATQDPRFPAMTPDELNQCRIEVSALTSLRRVEHPEAIRLGTDGVYVAGRSALGGRRTGCFLPQVAARTGWDRERFLSILCRDKAGLHEDAWKDPSTELYVFQAEVFGEDCLPPDRLFEHPSQGA